MGAFYWLSNIECSNLKLYIHKQQKLTQQFVFTYLCRHIPLYLTIIIKEKQAIKVGCLGEARGRKKMSIITYILNLNKV